MKQLAVTATVLLAAVVPGVVIGDVGRTGPPLADAGLDQSVERDTTVFLDGTGSRDPGGRLIGYDWRIETPSGTIDGPNNRTAARTSFVVRETGRYVVTLTVTDDSGETASDTLYVDVEGPDPATSTPTSSPPDPATPVAPTPSPTTTTTTPSTTSTPSPVDHSPTIDGPQLVTGDRPLDASYSIETTGTVDTVEWTVDGTRRVVDETLRRSWTSGDHTLRAEVMFVDGETDVATFDDGTTAVVADPRPSVTLSDVERRQRLGGTASADDGYGNLDSVTVSVDGLGTERVTPADGASVTASFDWTDVEPGRTYDLVVTATDDRGQETTVARSVTPVAPPETISSEFVNGPVDSYHPRIDAGRYTAHHVLKIALNGNSIDDFEFLATGKPTDSVRRVAEQQIVVNDGIAAVHSYWAGNTPSEDESYRIRSQWSLNRQKHDVSESSATTAQFEVTPSHPELRITMRNDGAEINGPNGVPRRPVDFSESITVDASESFDPDGTSLTYMWDNGATPEADDNTTALLSATGDGNLTIEDESGARVSQLWDMKDAFVPDIASTSVVGDGPFRPNQRVTVKFETQRVLFRQNSPDFDVAAELKGAPGDVVEWQRATTRGENRILFRGKAELPASALAENNSTPRIVLYNRAQPEHARKSTRLPTVELTEAERTQSSNLEVTDIEYVIRERTTETVDADTRAEMRQLRNVGGYDVVSEETETVGYNIEEKVRTQKEIVETETRSFGSSSNRRTFLRLNPDWRPDGKRTTYDRTQEVTTSWKRNKGGAYTGETRRVLVDPAEKHVEREYEYTTTEEEEKEMTSRQCLPMVGCYEETYYETVTKEVTHTYWAASKHWSTHSATGNVRRTVTDPAEYATEYEHEYTSWDVDVEHEYVAKHTTVVQPDRYEWQQYDTVSSQRIAWQQTSQNSDLRIGSEVTESRWTLEKQVTDRVIRPAYTSEDKVVETRATVSGDVIRYRTSNAGFKTGRFVEKFTTEFVGGGVVSEDEIEEWAYESEVEQ